MNNYIVQRSLGPHLLQDRSIELWIDETRQMTFDEARAHVIRDSEVHNSHLRVVAINIELR